MQREENYKRAKKQNKKREKFRKSSSIFSHQLQHDKKTGFLQVTYPGTSYLFQLFQERLRFKVFRNEIVQSRDHFVNLFFPRWIQILGSHNGFEELPKGLLHYPSEP